MRTKSKPIKRMLRLPQNRRRRKNAPAQHTLAACIESPDRCGTAAPQRHSFTMPPTTYRPAQDGRLAAQRPLCCWAAAAQIPIHRQIRRADLACLLKISEAIYAGCSNTKACPSCARKNRARLTRCLHPTCHRWSAAPAKTRRRVLTGAASGANGRRRSRRTRYRVYPSRTRSIFSPQRSASFRLFPIASLPKFQAPDACGASLPIVIEIPPNAGIALHSGVFDPYCLLSVLTDSVPFLPP